MARNVALFGRRELEAHRKIVSGVTVSPPEYKVVDGAGNKEWTVDVYIGPPERIDAINVVRDVPVAPYAKQLVSGMRVPVMMERSRQGKYTVIGRTKVMPSGAQTPDDSILEPTYHEITYNLAELGLLFLADLDWKGEKWGEKIWGATGTVWKGYTATDAFGYQVVGPDADPAAAPAVQPTPAKVTTTRHVRIGKRPWGSGPDHFRWGIDRWGAPLQKVLELTT